MKLFDLFAGFLSTICVLATDPVCIIGAGPSGLTAAHELERRGYSVAIFEKQDKVGGKCQAYYDQ